MIIVYLREAVSQERVPVLWGQKVCQVWAREFAVVVRCLVKGIHWTVRNVESRLKRKPRAGNVDLAGGRGSDG